MNKKILISACLAGQSCRYDGKHCKNDAFDPQNPELLLICPEQLGGLSTPRDPAEIQKDGQVLTTNGANVSEAYAQGAAKALEIALTAKISKAYLKSKSPMCGYGKIYDGTFSGKLTKGNGIFAQQLSDHKIEIITVD